MARSTQEEYVKAKTALALSQKEKIDFKLSVERGQYLPVLDVKKAQEDEAMRVKTKLLALPARLSARLVGVYDVQEIYSLLSSAINEVLNELSVKE